MQVINNVNRRITYDLDIKALDDLKPLATNDAVASLLMFFNQNQHLYKATAKHKEIAARAAQLATELPNADAYFMKVFRKTQPSRGELQRDIAIESLVLVHNNFAVRLVAQALSDPELGVPIGKLGSALAKMELPSAPFSSSQLKESATDDGIAKWKEWWEANKAQYQ
jgi:hypothetical protein